MATVKDALTSLSLYPIPLRTLDEIACNCGVELTDEITTDMMHGKAYNLAKAEVLLWLSYAPNISQGGQSYSFTDEQRTQFRNRARALYDEFGEGESAHVVRYGYKGSRL